MKCKNCNSPIGDNIRRCPYCNIKIERHKKTNLGKISLMLSFIAICMYVVILLAFLFQYRPIFTVSRSAFGLFMFIMILFLIFVLLFPIIGVITGISGYRKNKHDKFSKYGTILGVILVVLTIFSNSIFMYSFVTNLSPEYGRAPRITFTQDKLTSSLVVTKVSRNDMLWSDVFIVGEYSSKPDDGYIMPGDRIYGCHGHVEVIYEPTNMGLSYHSSHGFYFS